MGHVTGKKSKLSQKVNKSNLNSNSNYKGHFCPLCLILNPFGIWGCDKKQSWSLFNKDQLWYSKFWKFTYKIWSNFEMIQILKCTPNSNFNGGKIRKYSLKQSCRVWKVKQLLFLEIFNFFRNFGSNLNFKTDGNSVILVNSARPPPHHRRPFSGLQDAPVAALGFMLAWDGHCVSFPRSLGRAIKLRRRRRLSFLSSVSRRRRLSSVELTSAP